MNILYSALKGRWLKRAAPSSSAKVTLRESARRHYQNVFKCFQTFSDLAFECDGSESSLKSCRHKTMTSLGSRKRARVFCDPVASGEQIEIRSPLEIHQTVFSLMEGFLQASLDRIRLWFKRSNVAKITFHLRLFIWHRKKQCATFTCIMHKFQIKMIVQGHFNWISS